MWKNIVEPERPQMKIWRMRILCWIPNVTNTKAEYIIRIAFPLHQWLQVHLSLLCYTCIACLVKLCSDDSPDVTVQWVTLMLHIR